MVVDNFSVEDVTIGVDLAVVVVWCILGETFACVDPLGVEDIVDPTVIPHKLQ